MSQGRVGEVSECYGLSTLFPSLDCCEDMLNEFYKALRTGLDLNSTAWWREVKHLSGARVHSGAMCNHIHAVGAKGTDERYQ